MTAPKIDTQAPERIWVTFGDSSTDDLAYEGTNEYFPNYILSSLSAAREAAAWITGRDAALNEFDRVLYWPQKEGAQTKHFRQVLTPPTDPAAALDRLIAERVREAVEAERERIACEITRRRMVLHQQLEVLDISREDAVYQICADVARVSKEGRS